MATNAPVSGAPVSGRSAVPAAAPAGIDPRGPRTNQAVLALGLAIGFLVGWWPVAPLFAVVLGLGVAFGPAWGPVLLAYRHLVSPRLAPPRELEDPRPPRFAAAVGVVFLVAATVAFVSGATTLGWVLTLVVAALAALAAVTGLCVGCEMYLWAARLRGRS
jgi:hypothetical protein